MVKSANLLTDDKVQFKKKFYLITWMCTLVPHRYVRSRIIHHLPPTIHRFGDQIGKVEAEEDECGACKALNEVDRLL